MKKANYKKTVGGFLYYKIKVKEAKRKNREQGKKECREVD